MLIRIKNDNNIKQMTQSLLEKLKPEVVEALENNRNKYDFSITDLYTELDCKYLYSQLSVGIMRDLILYADIDVNKWDSIDWRFGDKLFNNERHIQ